ncbi:MAG: metalloregulator ArsR/SmtB family transcription factor [Actinomycetota bacterium]
MSSSDSDAVFSALADPTRRSILSIIGGEREITAGEIADRCEGVGRTAVSGHLRVLRLAGLVSERREGRYRFYSVTASPADTVVSFLTSVYRHSLDDLATAVDAAAEAADEDAESG